MPQKMEHRGSLLHAAYTLYICIYTPIWIRETRTQIVLFDLLKIPLNGDLTRFFHLADGSKTSRKDDQYSLKRPTKLAGPAIQLLRKHVQSDSI